MNKLGLIESSFPDLSSDEMVELERIYKDMGEKPLDRKFCQEIAKCFSSSSNGAGKTPLSWQQVQQWFKNRQRVSQGKDSSSLNLLALSTDIADSSLLGNGDKSSSISKVAAEIADISELQFEARSTKDIAWHDVAMFLNYRVLCTGELEVRVRYAGFGKEQDEWMNVKQGVRERSVPLDPSDCHKVMDGDSVLCFLVREDYALYCDARVVQVQRRIHDPTECTCTFTVQFLHDNTQEALSWNDVCCRPSIEEPVVYSNPTLNTTPSLTLDQIESLWG